MKKNIHPEYYKDAVIHCACGNEIVTGSTVKEARVEICSKCHPFLHRSSEENRYFGLHRSDRKVSEKIWS